LVVCFIKSGVSANLLGRCLTGRKQFADAEPLLLQAYEMIRKYSEPEMAKPAWVDRIAKAKVDIVTLYNCDVVQLLGQA
jgi:hypothetical protein